MLGMLLLAFIIVPLVELYVIGQVGDAIGFVPTLAILLIDSLAGAVLVRREGRRAWTAFREALAAGRWPGDEVVQGALVLVGGALLLTPGFVTDVFGLLLVLPPTRAIASRLVRERYKPQPLGGAGAAGARQAGPHRSGPASGATGPFGTAAPRTGRSGQGEPGKHTGAVYDVEIVSVERDEPPTSDPDELDPPRG